jgi:hypothetical protein
VVTAKILPQPLKAPDHVQPPIWEMFATALANSR